MNKFEPTWIGKGEQINLEPRMFMGKLEYSMQTFTDWEDREDCEDE